VGFRWSNNRLVNVSISEDVYLPAAVSSLRKLLEVAKGETFVISATERARIEGAISTLEALGAEPTLE
jgi:hypothetical protein